MVSFTPRGTGLVPSCICFSKGFMGPAHQWPAVRRRGSSDWLQGGTGSGPGKQVQVEGCAVLSA